MRRIRAAANARHSIVLISSGTDSGNSEKEAGEGRKKQHADHCIRFGCSWAVAQKKDGTELALQEPIPVALSGKIIKIFLRIATIPILFLCHSLRTAHRIQKTCVLFFAVLPLFLFRVRYHSFPEDISDSLRRALAAATPPTPQCPGSIPLRFISLGGFAV